jgi:Flp pilus assembly protein TadG
MRWLARAGHQRLAVLRRTDAAGPSDEGAVALLVAVLFGFGVILAMAALTVDVGRLYFERRQLQNGADAAALAVVQDAALQCVTGPCSPGSRAQSYANANSADGTSAVVEVCGAGWSAVGPCAGQATPALTQCPAVPAGTSVWVRVRTATRVSGGGTLLPGVFARALAGNGGYVGTRVFACAEAGLGAPAAITTLPLTMSLCQWSSLTGNGSSFAKPPPYPPYPTTRERAIYLHDDPLAGPCRGGAGVLPGGFGWLSAGSNCSANLVDGSTVRDRGDAVPPGCASALSSAVRSVVFVPVFDRATGFPGVSQYHLSGFASFYLTGYSIPGRQARSVATGRNLCNPTQVCLYGWFTTALAPVGGTAGGTPRGTSTVRLVG